MRVEGAIAFPTELVRAAAARGLGARLVSDEIWRVGPLTVAADRRRGKAEVRYARVVVARARCDATDVMRAWVRAFEKLSRASLEPAAFFERVAAGYAALLAGPPASRVALADVAGKVCRAGYTRAQLAWDFARLRREHGLAQAGRRILLDVATGQVGTRKSRVVWIEDEAGSGHYYETIRVVSQ